MINVHIAPNWPEKSTETGGIRRVVDAQIEHLGKFGIQVVSNPDQAHIINNHGGMLVSRPGVPMVNTSHGLYWSRQPWGDNYQQVNQQCIESMRQAVAHTAPSEWVAKAIRRGGLWYPEVVLHGVSTKEFVPSPVNGDYVIWAKARADYVSDPNDMMRVARLLPGRRFVSTIGNAYENVEVLGPVPYDRMNKLVAEAGVFLSTARETFGIGTLEALACGVPIAGWDWGGNSEIVIQGVTGYLAHPGDFKALAECIERCYAERETLSANCVEDARTRWQWEPRVEQYANIFKRVYNTYYERESKPKVSVIVTSYKLDQYLPACLDSISKQTYGDFECLVVDDAQLESTKMIVADFSARDPRIQYSPTPHNMKLSGARNFGFSRADGLYIRHMDADDMLAENALALEAEALDKDPGTHIVFGHLEVFNEDGSRQVDQRGQSLRTNWPGETFNWFQQMAHLNQLPSTCMVRREVFERSGGYRERMKRAEDAEFWCRVTSLGFRARKITQAVTMFHRERPNSKGATEWKEEGKEPDWTSWFPWRMGAGDYGAGRNLVRRLGNKHPNAHLVPFGAQGQPDNLRSWMVNDYSYPVVSVIITCGPGHKGYLIDALDSVQAQTFTDWECVVVNDTGTPWPADIMGAPYARVVNMDGNEGTSAARNEGYKYARGRFIVWLDADDFWLPWFLEKTVAYAEKNDGVIFSDMIKCEIVDGKEKMSIYRYPEFECDRAAVGMQYSGSSVLYSRKAIQSVFDSQGGYDLNIPGMEDKDLQTAVHANGFCAYRVPEPLWVYRLYSTTKRESDYNKIDKINAYMDEKWSDYRTGVKKMGCGCGTKKTPTSMPNSTMTASGNFTAESLADSSALKGNPNQMVEVEYLGPIAESFSVNSRVRRDVMYRFGNNEYHKIRAVFLADAEYLIGIKDGDDKPLYRIVAAGATMEEHDPTAFLGVALEAA